MPIMNGGTLYKILQVKFVLTHVRHRISLALQIAKGLEYMECLNPPIAHVLFHHWSLCRLTIFLERPSLTQYINICQQGRCIRKGYSILFNFYNLPSSSQILASPECCYPPVLLWKP